MGSFDGLLVGDLVGDFDGDIVGFIVIDVGDIEGLWDGLCVGE